MALRLTSRAPLRLSWVRFSRVIDPLGDGAPVLKTPQVAGVLPSRRRRSSISEKSALSPDIGSSLWAARPAGRALVAMGEAGEAVRLVKRSRWSTGAATTRRIDTARREP